MSESLTSGPAAAEGAAGQPRDVFVDLPGRLGAAPLRMHYIDWGGEGLPIVLLHGLASSSRIWDWVAPVLAARFRVIAVDQRGHGLTDRPDSEYTFDEVCGDLAALLDALAFQRPVIAGHSWGAGVALQYAAEHPGALSGLVLVDGGFVEISASLSWPEAEKQMRPPEIDGIPLDAFVKGMRNWPGVREIWSPQLQDSILSNFEVRDGKIYRRLTMENHMKIVRAIYDGKITQLYPRIDCAVLLVPALQEATSDQERAWHSARDNGLAEAQRLLARSRLVPMPDTGHDIPVLRPAELASAVTEFAAGLA